jgi:hypothetical protein
VNKAKQMAKKDFTETIDDVRRELDRKIESKVSIWVFTIVVTISLATAVGFLGAGYSQLYNLAGRVSAIESTLNNSQHK